MCHTFGADVHTQVSTPLTFATIVGKWMMVRLKFIGYPVYLRWIPFLNVPAAIAKRVAKTKGVHAMACTEICGCTECENQQTTDVSDCDDVYNDVESDDSDVE